MNLLLKYLFSCELASYQQLLNLEQEANMFQ